MEAHEFLKVIELICYALVVGFGIGYLIRQNVTTKSKSKRKKKKDMKDISNVNAFAFLWIFCACCSTACLVAPLYGESIQIDLLFMPLVFGIVCFISWWSEIK
ncbi:hypothetical protein KAU11_07505 [Candidatus Babeliales bacterium]|nr:hypothetical protein [Candidatus Babeliales bacterium]